MWEQVVPQLLQELSNLGTEYQAASFFHDEFLFSNWGLGQCRVAIGWSVTMLV